MLTSPPRRVVVDRVVDHLLAAHPGDRPLRVGIDGITAAGKTTREDDLAAAAIVFSSFGGAAAPRRGRWFRSAADVRPLPGWVARSLAPPRCCPTAELRSTFRLALRTVRAARPRPGSARIGTRLLHLVSLRHRLIQ
jgi:hypothetical protein